MKDEIMALYLSQQRWGRVYLHLAAALRAGHWRWHLSGIEREMQWHYLIPSAIPVRRNAPAK
jgi:hypothetical protein